MTNCVGDLCQAVTNCVGDLCHAMTYCVGDLCHAVTNCIGDLCHAMTDWNVTFILNKIYETLYIHIITYYSNFPLFNF